MRNIFLALLAMSFSFTAYANGPNGMPAQVDLDAGYIKAVVAEAAKVVSTASGRATIREITLKSDVGTNDPVIASVKVCTSDMGDETCEVMRFQSELSIQGGYSAKLLK